MTMCSQSRARPYCVAPRPDLVADAPFDLCLTPEAMEAVLSTVGAHPPETGAKAFGPADRFGCDVVEFDGEGSCRAGGTVYSPDTVWGEERCRFWLNQPDDEMRLWTGDIHSHPGGFGRPSGKAGPGRGDLGYVEEVFAQNEAMQYFAIPIVTLPAPGQPALIWPWVVSRDDPHQPLWANLRVCPATEFPERPFNPAWEASLADSDLPSAVLAPDPVPMPAPGAPADPPRLAEVLGITLDLLLLLASFVRFLANLPADPVVESEHTLSAHPIADTSRPLPED